ncbi:MAG: PQQ-binding-like beta-propeller repeat protein [Planctomycetota bacterium]
MPLAGGVAALLLLTLAIWAWSRGVPREAWSHRTSRITTAPLVVGEVVVLGNVENEIIALDAAGGDALWQAQPASMRFVADGLLHHGEHVFLLDGGRALRALRLTDGAQAWRFESQGRLTRPAVIDDHLLVGEGNTIRWIDPLTGRTRRTFEGEDRSTMAQPSSIGGLLVAGFAATAQRVYPSIRQSIPGGLCAFDAEGDVAWSTPLPSLVVHAPTPGSGRAYAVAHSSGRLYAIEASTGKVLWDVGGGDTDVATGTAMLWRGRLDVQRSRAAMEAIHPESGEVVHQHEFTVVVPEPLRRKGVEPSITAPCIAEGRVYFGCLDALYCLDEASGALLWTFPVAGRIELAPSTADGRVFVVTTAGTIHAIVVR